MVPPLEALKERITRNENKLEDQQKMLHQVDKKVDLVSVGVKNLNDTVVKLNDTIDKNSQEGKARHRKSDIMGYLSPLIILSGVAALLTAIESGSLAPLVNFFTVLSGGQ